MRWDWLTAELQRLDQSQLRRGRHVTRSLSDGWCERDGVRLRDFASNDYLNLAGHESLREAAETAVREGGVGARASALISGRSPWHEHLEQRLAEFERQPAALLFPTGMAANIGTIAALVSPDDVVFCDRFNHASLVDGCRLSGSKLRVYRHDALDKLEHELAKASEAPRRWVVTDTVFSMDGDIAPLPALCDLAERYQAEMIVDEAHGTGVFGSTGRGVCEWLGVEDRVAVRIGTLSKAVGCLGGFVAGPQVLIDYLWNTARSQMFSTALPPAVCAAAVTALDLIDQHPEWMGELLSRATRFRQRLGELGITVPPSACGPIVPIVIGDAARTMTIARQLEARGFLVGAIRPPTVPQGTARLRVTMTLSQKDEAIDDLIAALIETTGSCQYGI